MDEQTTQQAIATIKKLDVILRASENWRNGRGDLQEESAKSWKEAVEKFYSEKHVLNILSIIQIAEYSFKHVDPEKDEPAGYREAINQLEAILEKEANLRRVKLKKWDKEPSGNSNYRIEFAAAPGRNKDIVIRTLQPAYVDSKTGQFKCLGIVQLTRGYTQDELRAQQQNREMEQRRQARQQAVQPQGMQVVQTGQQHAAVEPKPSMQDLPTPSGTAMPVRKPLGREAGDGETVI